MAITFIFLLSPIYAQFPRNLENWEGKMFNILKFNKEKQMKALTDNLAVFAKKKIRKLLGTNSVDKECI